MKYLFQPTGKPEAERPRGQKPKVYPRANRKGRTKTSQGLRLGTEDSVEAELRRLARVRRAGLDTAYRSVVGSQESGIVREVSPESPHPGSARTWGVRSRVIAQGLPREIRKDFNRVARGLGEFHLPTCRCEVTSGAIRCEPIPRGDAAGSPSVSAERKPVRHAPPDSGPICQHPAVKSGDMKDAGACLQPQVAFGSARWSTGRFLKGRRRNATLPASRKTNGQ
jgi:hypothetical protein